MSLTKACHDPGTDEGGNRVTAAQESAEGIVDEETSRETQSMGSGVQNPEDSPVEGLNGPLTGSEGKWKGN